MSSVDREDYLREREENQHHAERAHDRVTKLASDLNEMSVLDARETIKALMVINGGAAIAVLGFSSSLIGRAGVEVTRVAALTNTLVWFIVGLCLGVVVTALAYFTNSAYSAGNASVAHVWEHPYIQATDKSRFWFRIARSFHYTALALSVVSVACFVVGTLSIKEEIKKLTITATPPAQTTAK